MILPDSVTIYEHIIDRGRFELMMDKVEIEVITPKKLKISVPKPLYEAFQELVTEENLEEIIVEALNEELKRIRFRRDFEKASARVH